MENVPVTVAIEQDTTSGATIDVDGADSEVLKVPEFCSMATRSMDVEPVHLQEATVHQKLRGY